ncbi:MAG: CMP deaminase [Chitinophagia bacterium]|nr:CMP deaminase [Chitinophagia bacterium]
MKTEHNNWDCRLIELAKTISTWSKDPSTKVGAVIVDSNRRILSTGYNGFPKGIKDDERLENRDEKLEMIVHAEINAILFAERNVNNSILYTYPFMPCSRCAAIVIQSGIKKVVAPNNVPDRWQKSFERTKQMFKEAKVKLNCIDFD